ncbi:MAG: NifB/NifX family molybdenum-iron cluster-binding protein [Cellulosilyticaceae bacterium]
MKICMPTNENNGLKSMPYNHFGSAPLFVVYDTESQTLTSISNGDLGHQHGMCQPIKALGGAQIDTILVGGIGQGALVKLAQLGITAYRTIPTSFEENIALFQKDGLETFDASHVCTSHDCGHHHH